MFKIDCHGSALVILIHIMKDTEKIRKSKQETLKEENPERDRNANCKKVDYKSRIFKLISKNQRFISLEKLCSGVYKPLICLVDKHFFSSCRTFKVDRYSSQLFQLPYYSSIGSVRP